MATFLHKEITSNETIWPLLFLLVAILFSFSVFSSDAEEVWQNNSNLLSRVGASFPVMTQQVTRCQGDVTGDSVVDVSDLAVLGLMINSFEKEIQVGLIKALDNTVKNFGCGNVSGN